MDELERPIDRLTHIVRRLVSPGGCAWHAAQTHESLTQFLIEETYEAVDAIERDASATETRSELGDVLYQVLFHAALADKLVARHPHVFGNRGHLTVEELHAEWEGLKEDADGMERGSRAPLEGIPAGLPTLARAAKVVERLKRAKLVNPEGEATTADAIGEAMLSLVIQANANGIDADAALRSATRRYTDAHVPPDQGV